MKHYLQQVKESLATGPGPYLCLTICGAIEATPGPHQAAALDLIHAEIANLRIPSGYGRTGTYPGDLAASIQNPNLAIDTAWRQKVRHDLLDRLIQEAE
jgi:hypothetical protein